MSIGILLKCCLIYRVEMFVIEFFYLFFSKVAVLKLRSLFQAMVVVQDRMLHTLHTLLYRVKPSCVTVLAIGGGDSV